MEGKENIIQRLKKGDPDAFDQVFDKYYRKVYTFSLVTFKSKEDAEEAVQDVFYNLWNDRDKLTEIKDIEAWIFSICLNIIRKHFRKLAVEKKHLQKFREGYLDSDSSTVTDIEYRDLLEKTERLIEKLPPRQKTIFQLSRKESLSNQAISEKLGISVRTVDNQLSKAKAFLRDALSSEDFLLSTLFFFLFIK
ncbi:MAG TPA: RNA polymerase sigma-70 factor [Bacteroides sp.]|nr:RNA polymerase sigma-70 factor [Bacteroides sp.]